MPAMLVKLLGMVGAMCLPLVGAHYLFYSDLGIAPSDVGLDFLDIVPRTSPGLAVMLTLVAGLIIASYSIVVWMNVLALAIHSTRTSRRATQILVASGLGLVVALLMGAPSLALVALLALPTALTVLGFVALYPAGWKDMATGSLIGAPAYLLLLCALPALMPALESYEQQSAGATSALPGPGLVLGAAAFCAAAYVVLQLPSLLVLADDEDRASWGWARLRQVKPHLTPRRARVAFAVVVLCATYASIFALSYWNAEVIKGGANPEILGLPLIDQAVQHTYGLPEQCVAVKQVKAYSQPLPTTAIELGNRRQSGHVLVWDRRGAMKVPDEIVQLTPVRRTRCFGTASLPTA
jgi:hypothetical protein